MNCCLYLLYILDKYIGNFRPWNLSTLCQPLGSVAPTFTSSYLKKLIGDLEMWLVQDSYFGGNLKISQNRYLVEGNQGTNRRSRGEAT